VMNHYDFAVTIEGLVQFKRMFRFIKVSVYTGMLLKCNKQVSK
jgi:hypothetical protein